MSHRTQIWPWCGPNRVIRRNNPGPTIRKTPLHINLNIGSRKPVSLARNSVLQPQPDPSQALRSLPLRPPLSLPLPGTDQLYLDGISRHRGSMDALQWILRMCTYALFLDTI